MLDWDQLQASCILIVEDEAALAKLMLTVLNKEGFSNVHIAGDAEAGLAICQSTDVDCIVLDVMLPSKSGFDIAPLMRMHTDAPIVFVTARSTDLDRLTGFALGGDDYVTKPYNPLELVARIKAQLKRHLLLKRSLNKKASDETSVSNNSQQLKESTALSNRPAVSDVTDPSTSLPMAKLHENYRFGRFVVNEAAGELIVDGELVDCPAMVFQLLLFLCKHPNRVFHKSELYERVWGLDSVRDDNTVMVHIHRIRDRIEQDPANPTVLVTIRGMGYKLVHRPERGEGST